MTTITKENPLTGRFFGVGQPITSQNFDEALEEAGLNFTVSQQKLLIIGENQKTNIAEIDENHKVITLSEDTPYDNLSFPQLRPIVRDDNYEVISIMGQNYGILQNRECIEILKEMIENFSEPIQMRHGGNIKNCQKLFIEARFGEPVQIGTDYVEKSIMIIWSHTGHLPLTVKFIPFLTNEKNPVSFTCGTAMSVKDSFEIRHTSKSLLRLNNVKDSILHAQKFYAEIFDTFRELNKSPFNKKAMEHYLKLLFPDPKTNSNRKSKNEGKRSEILFLFDKEHDTTKTKWGAFKTVCKWVDLESSVKRSKKGQFKDEEMNMDSLWFGTKSSSKEKALKNIMGLD